MKPWVERHPYAALLALMLMLPVFVAIGAAYGVAEGWGDWRSDLRGIREFLRRANP